MAEPDTNPGPVDPLAGIPTPQGPSALSPEQSATAHQSLMESARAAGLVGGPGQPPGKVKEATFEEVFPGQSKPGESERLLREIAQIVRDIKEALDNLPANIAMLLPRT